MMRALVSRHRVFMVYLFSLLWLSAATLNYAQLAGRSPAHALHVLGVAVGTIVFYVAALRFLGQFRPSWTADLPVYAEPVATPRVRKLLVLMLGLYGIITLSHFLLLGNLPVLETLTADTDVAVSIMRQQGYFGLPEIMRYATDYSAKAIGPALLLLAYYFRSRLFWAVLVIGVLYCLGLFARVLSIILFLPLLVHLLLLRRWGHFAGVVAMAATVLFFVTIASSIVLRESTQQFAVDIRGSIQQPEEHKVWQDVALMPKVREVHGRSVDGNWRRTSALYALYERVLVVPGQVIYQWFDYYDEPVRREHGCGYRLLASWLGCSYVPIPSKLYAAFYREQYDQGMKGSLNAASFMTEFANFGPLGFLLSALLAGGLLVAVRIIYRNHFLALPMNLPLIVSTMESNTITAINSGAGWLLMTAIFIVFFRVRKE